ncbi:hypothetical protein E1181_00830 [Saccharopolyspora terrae]|uniref:Uncharacterized protein n=1 Tax=Saccharopolyspora terrae TaxID=2530384 RepID=A0A4R4W3U5_9PSEU|nr:DUF5677 domain-containing protein [Saccharopolyspora terrae]TDD10603.1 hypothetical protein E1181_00830 [Saccharopolyspora terrae]
MDATPADDPYSVLSGVEFLDEKLRQLDRRLKYVGVLSADKANLNRVQVASFQLVPGSASIARSIRHLIKGGYLLSSAVLLRPLLERVATLAYLEQNPQSVALWEAGWLHHQRPSLRTRLNCLLPGAPDSLLHGFMREVSRANSLIHGDPDAALVSLVQIEEDNYAYAHDQDFSTPERAHNIAFSAALDIVFQLVVIDRIFPPPDWPTTSSSANSA